MSRIKRVVLVQPESAGGNFEYVAIPRQGMLFISGALKQWNGRFLYDREIWFEDRSGRMDPDKDLEGVDILMISALINEAPRAYEIGKLAKQHHPEIITMGGGPLMSPLPEEAIREGLFDVIVNREGEDIIGQLCDVLLDTKPSNRDAALLLIPGISYMKEGQLIQTPRRGVIAPDFVELPDFHSIRDLTPIKPMAGGVIETVRGCTEKCTYCQVIQQFLGYRMVSRETEIKRLAQLRELAADGLIYSSKEGKFSVFISDDLHPPPLRAVKYRNERLERLKAWKGHTDNMYMICQSRTEVGQDPELSNALLDSGIEMLYVGVESSNAENLKLVNKRQDPNEVHKDMTILNKMGFNLVAMTIIGLPYDTEKTIMEMADWVKGISRYQTANLLTPLPATSNWALTPLDENGDVLQEGQLRPYHLYTGRQFVHKDERWNMQESRKLYDQYYATLKPVDTLYDRIFRILQRKGVDFFGGRKAGAGNIPARIQRMSDALMSLADSAGKELARNVSVGINQMSESLVNIADTVGKDVAENANVRIRQMSESLNNLADSLGKEITESAFTRMREMSRSLNALAESTKNQRVASKG